MCDAATHPHPVMTLRIAGSGNSARDALRRALADPDLDIVYPRVGTGGWIDEFGEATTTAAAGRAFTPIDRGGKPVAALIHDPALLDDPERMQAATDAASLVIDNERLKAQLQAQLAEMHASRARIVEAGERELRRVERDLHDGAQQRLVGLVLMLRLASREARGNPVLTELMADATGELDHAIAELRKLARGIHPAIVDDAGLAGALETLAERPGLPVELRLDVPRQLPHPVEIGAYFIVAEALTNANKHANASRATVGATIVDGALRVTVSDDGSGGASAKSRSGLEGLADRVKALGGRLVVESPPGGGTTVSADIPLAMPADVELQRRRLTALQWIGWENWEAPGELYEQLTDADNLVDVKAVLLCAGGSGQLTPREREWFIGYHTAAWSSDRVIELINTYDDSDTIEALMQLPGSAVACRGFLYEALRVCASDGPLTSEELDRVQRGAVAMSISQETFAELHEIVIAEQALRDRRYELITAPVLAGNQPVRP